MIFDVMQALDTSSIDKNELLEFYLKTNLQLILIVE